MIDIVFPKGNEDEFVKIAERLGLEGICFVYDTERKVDVKTKVKVYTAVLVDEKTIDKNRRNVTVMRCPDNPEKIRLVLERDKPKIFFSMEAAATKDFMYHRASGLNQVHAELAKKNNICIGLSFNDVLKSRKQKRSAIMGRMTQNIQFARKYKFPVCIASFATSPYGMRKEQDLMSVFMSLGMHPSEVQDALNTVEKIVAKHIKQ